MSTFIAAVMIVALSIGLVSLAEAQPPIRIGASLALTGNTPCSGRTSTAVTSSASST